jgi:hypothetical protein
VSARKADPSSQLNAGKSYVVFGKQDNTLNYQPSVLVPAAMADNSMASVLSCLPNTTYDLPAFN